MKKYIQVNILKNGVECTYTNQRFILSFDSIRMLTHTDNKIYMFIKGCVESTGLIEDVHNDDLTSIMSAYRDWLER